MTPYTLALQWRKENEKYIQPQDIWVWLEAAFVAGYKAERLHHERENMIDVNTILSQAFEQALRPLKQELVLLRQQHEALERRLAEHTGNPNNHTVNTEAFKDALADALNSAHFEVKL